MILFLYKKKDKWYLDSECSRHMMGDIPKFIFFKEKNVEHATFSDDTKVKVKGIGNTRSSSTIEHVLLVDSLKYNLLSISQLCNTGNIVIF